MLSKEEKSEIKEKILTGLNWLTEIRAWTFMSDTDGDLIIRTDNNTLNIPALLQLNKIIDKNLSWFVKSAPCNDRNKTEIQIIIYRL